MLLSALVAHVNSVADEQETLAKVTGYINDAIAQINVKMKAEFPYMDSNTDIEPPFPEKYQRTVLVPFAVGRIKQADSSQFEYSDAYSQFMDGLAEMMANYQVPEVYKEVINDSYSPDIYTTPPTPWNWRW